AAPSTQDPVTEEWNIVVEANRLVAFAATGTGPEHALLVRQARHYHVHQAAEHRSNDECADREVHQRAIVDEEIQHAAKISAANCRGEKRAVSTVRSASER